MSTKIYLGRRKTSVARLRITAGKGDITVNGLNYKDYFKRPAIAAMVEKPLETSETVGKYNFDINVYGGGLTGQAGAVRFAISRALNGERPELRKSLKEKGFLTRDSRKVERKKYGRKKARKSFQFSKR